MANHKTKTFDLGTVTYRMPNIVECMKLLGHLGFSRSMTAPDEGQEFIFVARLIENMKPMIVAIACQKAEQEIKTWEEALEHMEFMPVFSEIASEILEHLNPSKTEAKAEAETERKN